MAITPLPPIDDLAVWARDYAARAQAPAGQPNEVAERMTEIAGFLDQCVDDKDATIVDALVRDAASNVNIMLKGRCDTRRADVIPCGGDGAKVKCGDCPKRRGLAVYTRTLP